ncbi:DUF1996 domain-containing protein [Actinoplanes sp. CA-142083]|uniref:DUF1996 domain-containing protein n=1 Tax=Actinoplanes sp. CA-142083 TaxID=3239903 RepID=UPI003D90B3B3
MRRKSKWRDARPVRLALVAAVLVATGALTVTFVSSGGKGSADAATSLADFLAIEQVPPNVVRPKAGPRASTGRFTVDCGTNGNGKFSPDNPVAQPGVKNGAQHVHDFVGNLAITADSSDADLAASGTTCRNGDKSSYFWPVVRIDKAVRAGDNAVKQALASTSPTVVCPSVRGRMPAVPAGAKKTVDRMLADLDRLEVTADRRVLASRGVNAKLNTEVLQWLRTQRLALLQRLGKAVGAGGMVSLADCDVSFDAVHITLHSGHGTAATPQVRCPSVRDKLPGVPAKALDEVNRNLAELDRQISEANQRLVTGQNGNALVGPLTAKRTATLDRIAIAIARQGATRPQGLNALAPCTVDQQSGGQPSGGQPSGGQPSGGQQAAAPLPDPQGPNLELPNNTGGIVRPAAVRIEYRGNLRTKVVPMPKFLRELTGESKPAGRGTANARATWTCSGFADRLSDKYPVCPAGRQVQRVQDFPGCWDGKNIDSANHRDHVAFADRATGACPRGFVAIPQLRITISYEIPRDVQLKGQYALDSFPEENHNPFSDHNDFLNVNSARTMQRIATCINDGRRCA